MDNKPSFVSYLKNVYNEHRQYINKKTSIKFIEKNRKRNNIISTILLFILILLLNAIYIFLIKDVNEPIIWYEVLIDMILVFVLGELISTIRYFIVKFEIMEEDTNIV